ncbi:MAG TPA: DNA repair protein RadC [Burkholderiales bacterium]|nr:DNA repair protein RadC [Burkholderiales bacterium]
MLVGKKTAEKLYRGTLTRLLIEAEEGSGNGKLAAAAELVRRSLRETLEHTPALSSPQAVRDYLRLRFAGKEHEVFMALFLDAQNRVLAIEELFRGTLTQTSVFPREIVKQALHVNAAAVVFAHNHPSGVAEPSRADEALTQTLKHTLALVDIKVLDHFVVGGDSAMSFAERGLL